MMEINNNTDLTIGPNTRNNPNVVSNLIQSFNNLLPPFLFEKTSNNYLADNLMQTINDKVDTFNRHYQMYKLQIFSKNTLENRNVSFNVKPILYIELSKPGDDSFGKTNFRILYRPTIVEYDPNNPNGGNKKPKHYKSKRGSKRTKRTKRKNTRKYRMK